MGKMLQSYKKLFDDLAGGSTRRAYFLYGDDEYLKKEYLSGLVRKILPESNRTFNMDIFYGDEFDGISFDDRIHSFPLFASKRVVIIKKFESMNVSGKDTVIGCIAGLPESITLIIESSVRKLADARHKNLKKMVDRKGLSFNFSRLSDEESMERAKTRLAREGLVIDDSALKLLVASVGTELLELANEVDKIIAAAGPDKIINCEKVEQVIGKYRTESVFRFLDNFRTGESSRNMRALNGLLDAGEEPVFLLTMLLRRVLLLIQIKSGGGSNRNSGAESSYSTAPISPFLRDILKRQAAGFRAGELEILLLNLSWADSKLKSTNIKARIVLEEALLASSMRKKLATA